MAAKKKLEEVSKTGTLLARLKKNSDSIELCGLDTASNLKANWKYIDFVDPKTGAPCLLFEWLFGARGLLLGRMMKVEADQGVGKSTLLFALYGMAQKTSNAYCFHEESEGAPQPPDYIAATGCDPRELLIQQPGSIENCMAQIEEMTNEVRADDPDKKYPIIFGIDSVSGFGSNAEMDDPDDPQILDLTKQGAGMGAHARCLSKWFRDRGGIWMTNKNMFLICTAQLKDKILTGPGAMRATAEQKRGTMAEKPLNFNATFRLELRTQKLYDKDKKDIGETVTIKTLKNKVSPKHREVEIPLPRGQGFEFIETTVDTLRRFGSIVLPDGKHRFQIEQRGAYIECEALNIKEQSNKEGKTNILCALYDNQPMLMGIREALRIRGFGFKFEENYMPSGVELEDIAEPET